MSTTKLSVQLFALMALSALLSACSSNKTPPPPPPPPPATLTQIKADLSVAKSQLTATTATIDALGKSTADNAKANYERFVSEYDRLKIQAESNRTRVEDLKIRAQEYYDAWNTEAATQNPEIRKRMVEQRAEAEKSYSTIKGDLELGKLAFDSYMAKLSDVESFLRTDTSPARIGLASDLFAKANTDGKSVATHLDSIIAEIDKMMKTYAGN